MRVLGDVLAKLALLALMLCCLGWGWQATRAYGAATRRPWKYAICYTNNCVRTLLDSLSETDAATAKVAEDSGNAYIYYQN